MNLIELDNRILAILFELEFTVDDTAKDRLLDELATLQLLADTDDDSLMH